MNNTIKKGMEQATKDLVSSYVITKVCIEKLDANIKKTDEILAKFQI